MIDANIDSQVSVEMVVENVAPSGLFSLLNEKGEIIINDVKALSVLEGFDLFHVIDAKDFSSLINEEGEFLAKDKKEIRLETEGRYVVLNNDDTYSMFDSYGSAIAQNKIDIQAEPNGSYVIQNSDSDYTYFTKDEEYSIIKKGEKWSLLGGKGNAILEDKTDIYVDNGQFLSVDDSWKYTWYDKDGKEKVKDVSYISFFNDGRYSVQQDSKYSLFSSEGVVIDENHAFMNASSNGGYFLSDYDNNNNNVWTVFNKGNEAIIKDYKARMLYEVEGKYIFAEEDSTMSLLNEKGEVLIKGVEQIEVLPNDRVIVKEEGDDFKIIKL